MSCQSNQMITFSHLAAVLISWRSCDYEVDGHVITLMYQAESYNCH